MGCRLQDFTVGKWKTIDVKGRKVKLASATMEYAHGVMDGFVYTMNGIFQGFTGSEEAVIYHSIKTIEGEHATADQPASHRIAGNGGFVRIGVSDTDITKNQGTNSVQTLRVDSASRRKAILAEIDVQATYDGETGNIKACRVIMQHVKTLSEWQALVSTQHHRYGKLSYETHRFYYVREWVKPLVAALQKSNS